MESRYLPIVKAAREVIDDWHAATMNGHSTNQNGDVVWNSLTILEELLKKEGQ